MNIDDLKSYISSEEVIGHYTSRSIALEHIIPRGKLRFSILGLLNDPREYKKRNTGIEWAGNGDNKYVGEIMGMMDDIRFNQLKVASFSRARTDVYDDNRCKCFSLPNMWAYYGEKNKGVCLVFDLKELGSIISPEQTVITESIDYKSNISGEHEIGRFNDLSIIDSDFGGDVESFVESHLTSVVYPLLKQKDVNWENEQEYRIVLKSKEKDYTYINYGTSLKAIVLGLDFNEVYLPSLFAILPTGVEVFQYTWDQDYLTFTLIHLPK